MVVPARDEFNRTTSTSSVVTELRRLAIYTNYTGIIDTDARGGYGLLFGPARNGRVLGWEYLAMARETPDGVPFTVASSACRRRLRSPQPEDHYEFAGGR